MNKLKIAVIVEGVFLGLLGLTVIGMLVNSSSRPKHMPASLGLQPESMTEPETTARTEYVTRDITYRTTGEKVIMQDAFYGEIWLPVLEGVPRCERDPGGFVTRNGLKYYKEDGEIVSWAGVDVSSHQRGVDWEQVKDAGISFAMIRAGYRGYGSGETVEDEAFHENMRGAQAAGVNVGVYFYSQAVTPEEAVEEADMVIEMLQGYNVTYPVVFDWEIILTDDARTDDLHIEQLTECAVAFCERIYSAGYKPMIYQNKRVAMLKLDLPALKDYDFWLAEYADKPTFYYDYQIWQYCSDGTVPGIPGEVDLNVSFRDYSTEE